MLAFVDRSLFAAVAPFVQSELRVTDTALGALLGPAFALSYGAAVLLMGRVADRGGGRRLMLAGLFTWSAAAAALAAAHSVAAVLVVRVALGIGQAAFIPAALAMIAADARGRGAAMAIFTGGSASGRSIGLFAAGVGLALLGLAGVPARPSGWRWLCLLSVVPNLLLLMALAARLEARSEQPVRAPRAGAGLAASFVVAAAAVAAIQTVAAWLPVLVVRHRIADAASAPLLVGAVDLVSAPAGQLLGGWLLTRWRGGAAHAGLLVGAAIAAAVPALAVVVRTSSAWALAPALAAVNLLLGVASFAALFDAQGRMPAERRGVLTGAFLAVVTAVGAGLGPLLAGVISDSAPVATGRAGGDRLGPALLLSAIAAAVVAALAAASRRWSARRIEAPAA